MRKESIEKVSDFLRGKSGAATSSEIAEGTSLTEWTLRETLSSLEKEGKISINKKSRPYLYKLVDDKKSNMSNTSTSEDRTLATARILNFLKANSGKRFSNKAISDSLGLSSSTVSGITSRLSALKEIKIPAIRKSKSVISPLFQYSEGSKVDVEIERATEDAAVAIQKFLDANKKESFTKAEIAERVNCSEGSIGSALHSLLITEKAKVVSVIGAAKFQSIKGKERSANVSFIEVPNTLTISEYIKLKNLTSKEEKLFRKGMPDGADTLVYSSKGFRRVYSMNILDRVREEKCSNSKSIKSKVKKAGMQLFDLVTGRWIEE